MSSPEKSIDELVDEILSDPAYSAGTRAPSRQPLAEELVSVARGICAATRQIDAVIPEVAAKLGAALACHKGCPGKCCESLVLVSLPEALSIAEHLRAPERARQRFAFMRQARQWLGDVGGRAEQAAEALADDDARAYQRMAREHGRQHVMCPHSSDDCCDVYEVRPLKCRQAWVADTWEYCQASEKANAPKARLIAFDEMDTFFARASRVLAGLQSAAGHGIRKSPLPSAVLRLLDE